ncbi:hypothetical protein C0431_05795 [bacterium]|nr:hypothetical protein [bacterium]
MRALAGIALSATFLTAVAFIQPTKSSIDKDGLPTPLIPSTYNYANPDLPAHYLTAELKRHDNTPADNPITDAGATLGRVLFYDRRLSANNTKSCASCHIQKHNFADPERRSTGFEGLRTGLHAMSLTNVRYYESGHVFWTERDRSLERQAIRPILDPVELGTDSIPALAAKLNKTGFYPDLFRKAFGTPEITSDRIARAISQFERSLVSSNAKFDKAIASPKPEEVFSEQELLGYAVFGGAPKQLLERVNLDHIESMGCNECHATSAFVLENGPTNNGLNGGRGRFKVPSLRNIEVSAPYMHDGRFANLVEVTDHYMDNIQHGPDLDKRLRVGNSPSGDVERFRRSATEQDALIAFLKTLTDHEFLNAPKFSDPFNWPDN